MGARVSDEVWQRLEPGTDHARRGLVRRLWVAAMTLFALGFAANVLWISPLVTPRLTMLSPTGMSSLEQVGADLRVTAVIGNQGPFAVTILEVNLAGPGLELLEVEGLLPGGAPPLPRTLAAGERVSLVLGFRVADCRAVDIRSPWLVRATVQRPWGEMVVGASASFTTHGPEEDLVNFWCGL